MIGMGATHAVQTTDKTFLLVEELKDRGPCGVTELADNLRMGKSAVHNHLKTLEKYGYAVKEDGEYRIGLKFLEIGGHLRKSMKLNRIVEPELKSLAAETGELTNLMVEERGTGVYLQRAKGDDAVDLDTHAGFRTDLHTTALGKAILAYLPPSRVEKIIEQEGLQKKTPRSIGTREELYDTLETVRERGYAIDDEEHRRGLQCVAAPVKTSTDDVLGAISISAPANRISDDELTSGLSEKVLSGANVVELNLNY